MTLRPSELLAVCSEVAGALAGRPVQKVVQPATDTLLLGFPRVWLQITVSPRAGRIHLLEERPPGTGEAAPAFCMLLRKELVGARLLSVEAVAGERACGLDFTRAGVLRRLVVLLYGAGARLALTDGEGRTLGAIGPGRATRIELPAPRADEQPARFASDGISRAVAAHYAGSAGEGERVQGEAAARRAIGKLARRARALEGDLARARAAADRRRHADLLLAHLAEVPRGAAEVTLPDDFEGAAPVRIALDPARSASDNAARLYKEHKRMARGRASIEARLSETRAAIAAAEERLARGELAVAIVPTAQHPARRAQAAVRPPYRSFRSASGAEILVGRGAEKNDQLTFRIGRGDDLWLHTRDFPGAHVIVPARGRQVDEQTLLDAATLAAHHSPARDEGAVDVTYAPRKQVRKPKGAAPGLVSVAGGKTLRVRLEPERLARLLATRSE